MSARNLLAELATVDLALAHMIAWRADLHTQGAKAAAAGWPGVTRPNLTAAWVQFNAVSLREHLLVNLKNALNGAIGYERIVARTGSDESQRLFADALKGVDQERKWLAEFDAETTPVALAAE